MLHEEPSQQVSVWKSQVRTEQAYCSCSVIPAFLIFVRPQTKLSAAQLCEYTKKHEFAHFGRMNIMAYELYLIKTVQKDKERKTLMISHTLQFGKEQHMSETMVLTLS